MFGKTIELLKSSEIAYAELDKKRNKEIVETAGFVPLEVKLKRFEQNGLMAQFNDNEFTSSDLRTIYLTPDFEISPEDDFEEIQEKLQAQQNFINELRKQKTSAFPAGNTEVAPQAQQQKTSKKTEEVNENSSGQKE